MTHQHVALVTGGAKRIGSAIVRRLARQGYAVAIHCHHSREEATLLAQKVMAEGGNAAVVQADLMDFAETGGLIGNAAGFFGPLTLLVNNASLFESDTIGTLDAGSLERNLAVNMKAPIVLAQEFARQAQAGGRASIVNIIDHRVFKLTPQHFSYTLAKAGLWTATQTMAQAFAPAIRVNAVGPGPTLANIHDGSVGFEREAAAVPLGHSVAPEEIAEAVAYLAGARSVTGQMICVDAGQHIGWRTPDIVDD